MMRRFLEKVFSLGSIQAAQMLLPLLALPYLSRTLGKESFGIVMYLGVVTLVMTFVLDWGFLLGGVRCVARQRGRREALSGLWWHGLLAKALLLPPLIGGGVLFFFLFPHPSFSPLAMFWASLVGIARGFSPLWFFQGKDDDSLRRLAVYDLASTALLLLLMVVLIRGPEDASLYLALLALSKIGAYGLLCLRTCRAYCFRPTVSGALALLRETRVFFVGGIAGQTYSNWSQLGIGGILPAREMGLFLAADKISRAIVSMSNPLSQALFPEICALHGLDDAARRLRLQRMALLAALLASAGGCALVELLAPAILQLALGQAPEDAVLILRLLALVIPLLSLNQILGPQLLVPKGKEHVVTLAQICAAVVSIPTALTLTFFFGLPGAAALPLLAEGCIFIILCMGIYRHCPEQIPFFQSRNSGT